MLGLDCFIGVPVAQSFITAHWFIVAQIVVHFHLAQLVNPLALVLVI
jgi:hypothetical protein